jgi:flavin-dependent thymidylate synthase
METRRPTSPAAEEILGGYFPVLDHGFVALVDYMGSDEDVERAARVSYGYGTRRTSQTRGLIRYLRRHHHTTPSEMVELKFHCVMPIFVARQWIRHRTACLARGTEVHFENPDPVGRSGDRLLKLSIEEVWSRFHANDAWAGREARPDPHRERDEVREWKLRQLDEHANRIRHTRVVDVFRNGRRPVFRMVLADGKSIECTADHRFLFAEGWRTLRDATGLEERSGRAVWTPGDHDVHVNGVPCDEVGVGDSTVGLAEARSERPLLVRVSHFEYVGIKDTYDLEVEGPHHNFVANGIVTHNSVNELSARYSLMPLLFYRPAGEQFALQSRSNKQGREGGAPPEVYAEAVERWDALRKGSGDAYGWMLEQDVARELARIDLPLSTYTQWYWKIDLHNLLHFLTLRVDPRAQWEIQEYARVMAAMVKRVAPLSYEAWIDYDLCARPFTRVEREALSRLIEWTGDEVRGRQGAALARAELTQLGLSSRELAELEEKLQSPGRPDFELDLGRMRSAEDVAKEMEQAVPGTRFE